MYMFYLKEDISLVNEISLKFETHTTQTYLYDGLMCALEYTLQNSLDFTI